MNMYGCNKASTDEAYRKVLKKRLWRLGAVAAAGILIVVIAFLAEHSGKINASETMLAFYKGAGVGLAAACMVFLVCNALVLRNEEKLHRQRIAEADERNTQVLNMALKTAFVILLVGIYLTIFIGGLWYPILALALGWLVTLFVISFGIAYVVISRRI